MKRQPKSPAEKSSPRARGSKKPAGSKRSSTPTIDMSKLSGQLKELRLPMFREQHPMIAEQAAREGWTHLQFLSELATKECQARHQNRIERLMRNSNLLAGKTWEQFQWSRLPLHVRQQFETLRSGRFLDRQDNLLIFGAPGTMT